MLFLRSKKTFFVSSESKSSNVSASTTPFWVSSAFFHLIHLPSIDNHMYTGILGSCHLNLNPLMYLP